MSTIAELLGSRADLVRRIEALETELTAQQKELATLDEAILLRFDDEGMTSTRVDGLGSFSLGEQDYFQIRKELRDDVLAAFKSAYPSMVQETINANTLSAFMREAAKTNQALPDAITKGVSSYRKRWIAWRRG